MNRALPWVLLAGLGSRIALAFRTGIINTDGPTFMTIARGFLEGDYGIATRMGFHPFYPALTALFGGSETAAILVSIAAGVLAGWPLWLLVKDLAGDRAAFLAVALYELHPAFIDIQSDIFADGVFILLVSCCVSGAVRYRLNGRGLWMAAIGCGLGFLTKSEGLVVAGLTVLTIAWGAIRDRRPIVPLALAAALVLVIVVPYVVHLSNVAGSFRFSPKLSAIAALSGGGWSGSSPSASGRWAMMRESKGPLISSLAYLGSQAWRTVWTYAPLLLIALCTVSKWGPRMKGKGVILGWIAISLMAVWWSNYKTGHQISDRYLLPAFLFTAIYLGCVLDWFLERMSDRTAVIGAVCLLVVGMAAYLPMKGRRLDMRGYREAGELILKRHGKSGARVSCHIDKVIYYAQGIPVVFDLKPPDADYWVFTDPGVVATSTGTFREVATLPEKPQEGERIAKVFAK